MQPSMTSREVSGLVPGLWPRRKSYSEGQFAITLSPVVELASRHALVFQVLARFLHNLSLEAVNRY
jgi:hypothetical protein